MQTVFVCGGRGARLRPAHRGPKTLLEIRGQSLLARLVRQFSPFHRSTRPPVVIVDASDHTTRHVAGRLLPDAEIVVQSRPDGVARALLAARPALSCPALVVLGDLVLDGAIAAPPECAALYVWVGARPDDVLRNYGVRVSTDGVVTAVLEKPVDGHVWACGIGVYVIDDRLLDVFARQASRTTAAEYGITDGLEAALGEGVLLRAVPFRGFYRNVNDAADVAAVEAWLQDQPP